MAQFWTVSEFEDLKRVREGFGTDPRWNCIAAEMNRLASASGNVRRTYSAGSCKKAYTKYVAYCSAVGNFRLRSSTVDERYLGLVAPVRHVPENRTRSPVSRIITDVEPVEPSPEVSPRPPRARDRLAPYPLRTSSLQERPSNSIRPVGRPSSTVERTDNPRIPRGRTMLPVSRILTDIEAVWERSFADSRPVPRARSDGLNLASHHFIHDEGRRLAPPRIRTDGDSVRRPPFVHYGPPPPPFMINSIADVESVGRRPFNPPVAPVVNRITDVESVRERPLKPAATIMVKDADVEFLWERPCKPPVAIMVDPTVQKQPLINHAGSPQFTASPTDHSNPPESSPLPKSKIACEPSLTTPRSTFPIPRPPNTPVQRAPLEESPLEERMERVIEWVLHSGPQDF